MTPSEIELLDSTFSWLQNKIKLISIPTSILHNLNQKIWSMPLNKKSEVLGLIDDNQKK